MKRKIILRAVLGLPFGILIGYLITICISLGLEDGNYHPVVPELVFAMGNEINAVLLQVFLSGLLGACFGAISVIWEIESWSMLKQTGVYFVIISVIMLPIAYSSYWMAHSISGLFSYFAVFVLAFIVIWIIQFVFGRYTIKKMNVILNKSVRKKH